MQVSVHGATVAMTTGGRPFDRAKPTMVLIHGAGMDGSVWHFPSRAFAHRGWNALAVDLPGHGRSAGPLLTTIADMSRWVEDLLSALGVTTAGFVGHSMGGAIALETAARFGARTIALGLVGTAAAIPVSSALLSTAQDAPEQAYKLMVQGAYSRRAKIGHSPVPGLWMTSLGLSAFHINPRRALAVDLAACNEWSTGAAAAALVACPTAIVAAADDVMTPAKRGADLARLIPNATLTVLPRVGHMITTEAPDELLSALRQVFTAPDQSEPTR